MPHVSVRLWPGRDEETKQHFANALVDVVSRELKVSPDTVSVELKEVSQEDWQEQVVQKEIKGNLHLYVKPAYVHNGD